MRHSNPYSWKWYEILFFAAISIVAVVLVVMLAWSFVYSVKNCEQWATVKTGATICEISTDGRHQRCKEETMLQCVAWKQPTPLPAEASNP